MPILSIPQLLFIDPSAEDCRTYSGWLQRDPQQPRRVAHTQTGQEGLGLARALRPDCVLLGLGLPDVDDLELLDVLAAQPDLASTPVILIIPPGHESMVADALRRGAHDYLVRGQITPERLGLTVQHTLTFASMQRTRNDALARLEALLTSAPFGMAFLDTDLRYIQINERLASINRLPVEQHLGRPIHEVLPMTGERFGGWMRQVMETSRPILDAEFAVGPPERLRYWQLIFYPVHRQDGQLLGVGAMTCDITEHKRTEQALQQANSELEQHVAERTRALQRTIAQLAESEQQFRMLATRVPVGIFQTDVAGECVFVNDHWCRLADMRPEQAVGTGWSMALHPDDHAAVLECWNAAEAGGVEFSMEYRLLRPDGTSVWVAGGAAPLHNTQGTLIGYMGTVSDITARKQAEHAARAALSEKQVLLKEIHHRVKNNLQVIASLLRLQTSGVTDQGVRELFFDSQNRIQAMALVHEQLYRTDDLAHVNLVTYLRRLASNVLHSYEMQASHIRLRFESEETIVVSIDTAIPLGLILTELVSNGVKYAFQPGQQGDIAICLSCEADQLTLAVRDSGVGLPASIDPRTATTLGLQLVFNLTDQIGGTLQIERQGGTCFLICAPLQESAPVL